MDERGFALPCQHGTSAANADSMHENAEEEMSCKETG